MVKDRATIGPNGLVSRALFLFERRALRAADRVIVDTVANERYLVQAMGLDAGKVRSMPLATDTYQMEDRVGPPSQAPLPASTIRPMRIVFIGTFIPLHGLVRLLEQLAPLLSDPRFSFLLVGDGQEGQRVSKLLKDLPSASVMWIRDWQSPAQLSQHVKAADVCLGVFGGSGKAARVLPFKVYLYLAAGRPILTQSEYSLPAGAPRLPAVVIEHAEDGAAVRALLSLHEQPELRAQLSRRGASYFHEHLSRTALARHWSALLLESRNPSRAT
jgi:glycosyltransferase involved in cell wall biosynthesis